MKQLPQRLKAMRSIYFSEASDVASEALELSTAQEIRELLNTRFGNRMGNIFEK